MEVLLLETFCESSDACNKLAYTAIPRPRPCPTLGLGLVEDTLRNKAVGGANGLVPYISEYWLLSSKESSYLISFDVCSIFAYEIIDL